MVDQKIIEEFVEQIKPDTKESNKTHSAIVSKIDEEGTVWVRVAGSDKDTPTALVGTEVKKGDAVNVEWRNNKLYIANNFSNPSAGVVRVEAVEQAAQLANEAANNAVLDAGRAKEAADSASAAAERAQKDAGSAQTSAASAQDSANGALKGLSTVQDVIGALEWAKKNAEFSLTTDTAVEPGKSYWTLTATAVTPEGTENPSEENWYTNIGTSTEPVYQKTTDTTVQSGTTYYDVEGTPVATPVVADLGTYYEISGVDEAMTDYINTHLALTDEGLYVLGGANQWKVLIATDGVYIIDSTSGVDKVVARYGSTITLGEQNKQQINITSDSIRFGEYSNNLAYISEDKFYFLNGEILSSLFFKNFTLREGNDGKFIIGKR